MKLSELIEELNKQLTWHGNLDVVCFTAGENYPLLAVHEFEGVVEIACGWEPLEDV